MAPECHVSLVSQPLGRLRINRPESRSGRSPATPACLRAVILPHSHPLCNSLPHLSARSASIGGPFAARNRLFMRFFPRGRGGAISRKLSCSGKGCPDGPFGG